MAWKALFLVTVLVSLTECSPPSRVISVRSVQSTTFTRPKPTSEMPRTTSSVSSSVTATTPSSSSLRPASFSPSPKPAASPLRRLLTSAPPLIQAVATNLPELLRCIGNRESGFRYWIVSPYGDGGTWQYQPGTWDEGDGITGNGYMGYARAELAPPAMQDARALADYERGPAVVHKLWPNTSRLCGV